MHHTTYFTNVEETEDISQRFTQSKYWGLHPENVTNFI